MNVSFPCRLASVLVLGNTQLLPLFSDKVDVGEDLDENGEPKPVAKASTPSSTSSSAKPAPSFAASTKETVPAASFSSPTLDARAKFGANLFLLSGIELGWVFTELELNCPQVLESWGESKVEINVDEIPSDIFGRLQKYVNGLLEDGDHIEDPPDVVGPKKKKRKST